MLAILYLTLSPEPVPDTGMELFEGADKVVHAVMFGGLAGALCLDIVRRYGFSRLGGWMMTLVFVVVSLTGGGIELLQKALDAGRSCEFYDFVADSVGALIGVLVARPLARWMSASQDCHD